MTTGDTVTSGLRSFADLLRDQSAGADAQPGEPACMIPVCDWVTRDDDEDAAVCGQPSRFRIERPGTGYIPSESCEGHLAAQIATLLEGEDIRASVAVHWDGADDD